MSGIITKAECLKFVFLINYRLRPIFLAIDLAFCENVILSFSFIELVFCNIIASSDAITNSLFPASN